MTTALSFRYTTPSCFGDAKFGVVTPRPRIAMQRKNLLNLRNFKSGAFSKGKGLEVRIT
jgi:hypothetical protein